MQGNAEASVGDQAADAGNLFGKPEDLHGGSGNVSYIQEGGFYGR